MGISPCGGIEVGAGDCVLVDVCSCPFSAVALWLAVQRTCSHSWRLTRTPPPSCWRWKDAPRSCHVLLLLLVHVMQTPWFTARPAAAGRFGLTVMSSHYNAECVLLLSLNMHLKLKSWIRKHRYVHKQTSLTKCQVCRVNISLPPSCPRRRINAANDIIVINETSRGNYTTEVQKRRSKDANLEPQRAFSASAAPSTSLEVLLVCSPSGCHW